VNSVIIALIENFDHKQPLPTIAEIKTAAKELGVELTPYDLKKVAAILKVYKNTLECMSRYSMESIGTPDWITKATFRSWAAISIKAINAIRKAKEPTEANRDIDPARHIH